MYIRCFSITSMIRIHYSAGLSPKKGETGYPFSMPGVIMEGFSLSSSVSQGLQTNCNACGEKLANDENSYLDSK